MCGIVGIFNFNKMADIQLPYIVEMAKAMKHRGPDDEGFVAFQEECAPLGFYGDDTPKLVREAHSTLRPIKGVEKLSSVVSLAHRRLSIIDLTPGGHQPMSSADGRYWIVFNGEIYNYVELREELRVLEHQFISESDTEVILAAYKQWGVNCQDRFNGDWAIIIYDADRNEIFISRDRFGIKPLYYYQDNERILFASEIKGLLEHPLVKTGPNFSYLKSYLISGAKEWLKETAFCNIFKFPFGHFSKIQLASPNAHKWHPEQYWKLESTLSHEPFNQNSANNYAEQYYELLKDAVRIRLRSDVPVGCALSGGLDSSSIVYLIGELLNEMGIKQRVKAFSLIHKSKETIYCDESYFIYLVRDALNLELTAREPVILDIPSLAKKVLKYWENPPDGMGMAGMFTTNIAKLNGFVVTLDGQGADEQLGGYESYISTYLANIKGFSFVVESACLLRNFGWRSLVSKQILIAIFEKLPLWLKASLLYLFKKNQSYAISSNLNTTLAKSFDTGLVNLLHYSDSRTMLYSIESRMPFMDYRLVQLNASIPSAFKIHKGYTKYYARLAFEGRLPDEITWRKDKMGWPMPENEWLNTDLKGWSDNVMKLSSILKKVVGDENAQLVAGSDIYVRGLNIALFEEVFWRKNAI